MSGKVINDFSITIATVNGSGFTDRKCYIITSII